MTRPGCVIPAALLAVLLVAACLSPTIDLLSRPLDVPDRLHKADVIVAVSAGLLKDCRAHRNLFLREIHAAELLREGYSRSGKMIVSGVYTHDTGAGLAGCRLKLARLFEVSPEQLILNNTARTTHENILHTAELMRRNGWRDALLVTSKSHMFRTLRTFKKQTAKDKFTAYPVAIPDIPLYGENDWFTPNRLSNIKRLLYEYGALLKYKCYGYI